MICTKCNKNWKIEELNYDKYTKHYYCPNCGHDFFRDDDKYQRIQKEFDEEFDLNLNIEKIKIEDIDEFDPTNPKYYL